MPRLVVSRSRRAVLAALLCIPLAGCSEAEEDSQRSDAVRPPDVPSLHHAGLNSTDPQAAIAWYLDLWPTAERSRFAGREAVAAEMYLVFDEVDERAPGAFDEALGRSVPQSAFWHIGAFMNTTTSDQRLAEMGTAHLPLHTGRIDERVWRSGLTPYAGIVNAEEVASFEPADPRAGGFSYVLGPDGVLFEMTGGPNTTASLSHVHFFHEQPRCTANWYVEMMGMALPSLRGEDGSMSPQPPHDPCEGERGTPGWPSLESAGTIRQPRGTVVHGNGSMSWYPRQCDQARCGHDEPLAPSRGQVIDHLGLAVESVDDWFVWLSSRGVTMLEPPHDIEEGRAFMFEGPDRLAIELVELGGAP